MTLSVLHVNESDISGGAARSGYRIHTELKKLGHRSRMLVGRKVGSDDDVRRLKRHAGWRAADRAVSSVTDRLDLQYVCYPSSFGLVRDPWFREASVVQLYITHGSYFSHTALPLITRRRPLVWRLSDMWAFTGHVAYSYDCERWRTGCGECPYLHEYPGLKRDRTALLWKIKDAAYRRSRLTVAAPSRWIERLALESPLLGRFDVRYVPNGVDLDVFKPVDRRDARRRLGLDPDRPTALFAAVRLDDRRKGAAALGRALDRLGHLDFQLAVAGDEAPPFPGEVRLLGRLAEPEMALAYAAADVFVLPTLAENLPNAAVEALACGTPTVAFDVGGVGEAIRHLETGWLAPLGDDEALARGIETLLGDGELRGRLGRTARETAEREFGARLEAERYADLFAELARAA